MEYKRSASKATAALAQQGARGESLTKHSRSEQTAETYTQEALVDAAKNKRATWPGELIHFLLFLGCFSV